MKKLFALLLAVVMLLGLVACGENGGNTETQKPTEKPTEAPTQAPTEEPTQAPTEEPTQAPTLDPATATEIATADEFTTAIASVFGGYLKLTSDITITTTEPVKVFANVTLDLNGKTLEIKQNHTANVISIQGDYEPTTLTIIDSSAEGTGVLRAVASSGNGNTFIRPNLKDGVPNHFVAKSGRIEYIGETGAKSLRFFNITKGEPSATIEGGTFYCNTTPVFYNTNSHGPVVTGGTFSFDPTLCVAEGYKVETSTVDGTTWYTVVAA